MNQEVSIFKFEENAIRVAPDLSGDPWFVANDVCQALSLHSPRKSLSRLDDDEKGVTIEHTPGGPQSMNTVSESGLYTLAFKSRKPVAKKFRRWVTHEVIPAIRKRGYYYNYPVGGIDQSAGLVLGLAKHLVTLEQRIDKLEEKDKQIAGVLAPAATAVAEPIFPPVKEVPTRLKISQLIRGYAKKSGKSYKEIWDNLYYEFSYRYRIDLWKRTMNNERKTCLDIAEEMGSLEDLYSLARTLFVEARK